MSEKTETKHVSDVKMNITKMQWEVAKSRLVITTDKGRITCKPKKETRIMVKGLETIETVPMTIEDLPEKVFEVMRLVNEKGFATVIGSYQCFDTEADGEVVTYRFLNSIKQFEGWQVVMEGSSPSPSSSEPKVEFEGKLGDNFNTEDKPSNSDAVMRVNAKASAYDDFKHKEASLKELVSLGMLTQEEYDSKLKEAMDIYTSVK